MMSHVFFVALTLVVLGAVVGFEKKTCQPGVFFLRKDNCQGYFMCAFGSPVEMPDCPIGLVFSESAHVCVRPGSVYDDCNNNDNNAQHLSLDNENEKEPTSFPVTVGSKCDLEGEIKASPDACHLYVKCMKHPTDGVLHNTLLECPYPQLFSKESSKCEYFEDVICRERKELTAPCDYSANQCQGGSGCIPCSDRLASCQNQPDGYCSHSVKEWSPFYVYCYMNRTVSYWTCPDRTLYHPEKMECVGLDRIPPEHGGVVADCTGKADGFYADVLERCDRYQVCRKGKYIYSVQCEKGTAFEPKFQSCVESEDCS